MSAWCQHTLGHVHMAHCPCCLTNCQWLTQLLEPLDFVLKVLVWLPVVPGWSWFLPGVITLQVDAHTLAPYLWGFQGSAWYCEGIATTIVESTIDREIIGGGWYICIMFRSSVPENSLDALPLICLCQQLEHRTHCRKVKLVEWVG